MSIIKLIMCTTFPRSYEEDKFLLLQHLALQGYGVAKPLPADALNSSGPTLCNMQTTLYIKNYVYVTLKPF